MQIFLFFLCLFFSSCTPSIPFKPKQLRLVIGEDPATLDPRLAGDALSSHLQLLLFESLVKLHPDGSISPAQCSSFSLSEDQKTYTFFITNAYWSDGTPVTAHDFEKTWKAILSPSFAAPNAHLFYPIKNAELVKRGALSIEEVGIQALDACTLVVELEHPTPYFLELISFCAFSPYKETKTPNELLSNGPFVLHSWIPQRELLFKKNTYYQAAQDVHLDSICFSLIDNEMTAVDMYNRGEIDLVGEPFSKISQDNLPLLPKEDILSIPACATLLIAFNTRSFPFFNEKLRKAFHLAINREELLHSVMNQGDRVALSPIHPNLKKTQSFPIDLPTQTEYAGARILFKEALEELNTSVKELQPYLIYLYSGSLLHKNLAQALQQQWTKVLGVRVSLKSSDAKMLLSSLGKKDFIFAQATCRAQYFDPLSILERFQHKDSVKNYPSWEDSTYQSLLKDSFSLQGYKRQLLLDQAEELLLAQVPVSPLFHLSLCYAKKPHVHNIELSPSGGIFFERLSLGKRKTL